MLEFNYNSINYFAIYEVDKFYYFIYMGNRAISGTSSLNYNGFVNTSTDSDLNDIILKEGQIFLESEPHHQPRSFWKIIGIIAICILLAIFVIFLKLINIYLIGVTVAAIYYIMTTSHFSMKILVMKSLLWPIPVANRIRIFSE